MAYLERNPVRAGLVKQAEHWRWSSARTHLQAGAADVVLDIREWSERLGPELWHEILRTGWDEQALARRLREATRTGRPLADQNFIVGLERILGRQLRPGRPGAKPVGAALPAFSARPSLG
jgi:putative transposase